jgi:hypothetical protein
MKLFKYEISSLEQAKEKFKIVKSDNKNITEFEISKVVAGCQPFLWIDNPIQLHHTTKKLA